MVETVLEEEGASGAGVEIVQTVYSVDVIVASVSLRQRDISRLASLALEISLKTAVSFSENAVREEETVTAAENSRK